jgi:hypothetical protein
MPLKFTVVARGESPEAIWQSSVLKKGVGLQNWRQLGMRWDGGASRGLGQSHRIVGNHQHIDYKHAD